jgi:hypothetical protein
MGIYNTFAKKKGETSLEHRDGEAKGRFNQTFVDKLKNRASISVGGLKLDRNLFSVSLLPPTSKPFNYPKYKGVAFNWSLSLQVNPANVPIGLEAGKFGSFSYRYNQQQSDYDAYGYNHTNWGDATTENIVRDYFVEKDRPFNTSDYNIGIPYSSHDLYNVSGEGIAGSFRAFLPHLGQWSPRNASSSTVQFQTGFEVMVGPNLGIGLDFGNGYQRTTVAPMHNNEPAPFTPDEVLYRFNNDMGGQVYYGDGKTENRGPGEGTYNRQASGNSAHIKEIRSTEGNKLITGMEIVNKDGIKMLYGEPLMVRNETSLSININPNNEQHDVKNRFYAFAPLALTQTQTDSKFTAGNITQHQTFMGQIDPNEYATNFLLTEIQAPSYIDCDDILGSSEGDFGGWTRFSYHTSYGGQEQPWYRYRMPFAGLHYQQNSISDPKDDMGSVDTGEKQVKYLKTIETKTHIAYFVTNKTENINPFLNGSGNERYDGVGAKKLTANGDASSELNNDDYFDKTSALEYLEKIVLFTKSSNGEVANNQKPVKTVRFEYDYSLVPNVANNVNSNFNYYQEDTRQAHENNGKLTLRKVWFEYEGVVTAKISPYVFNYNYPSVSSESKLASFFSAELELADVSQNPSYEPFALDAWGNRTPNSAERRANGVAWVDQSSFVNNPISYDPAAYQLKSIRLPSGGTIHVQYESKDYAHVQDRTAMAMARVALLPTKTGPSYEEDEFYINVEDLGVSAYNQAEVEALAAKINSHFLVNESEDEASRKIYFKFLFSLLDDAPSLDNYRSEYITGYADFKVATVVDQSVGETEKYAIKVLIGGRGADRSGGDKSLTPRMACWEFVANQRLGKIANSSGIEPTYEAPYDDELSKISENNSVSESHTYRMAVLQLLGGMAVADGLYNQGYQNIKKEDEQVGQRIAEEYSFLKLPVLRNKIGGGARVKRVLLHDPGIESGDEVVLGTEYKYVMEDGITSSGVATNEPGLAREENPLVDFMPRKGESWWKQLVSGEVLDQLEGPMGEALLPGASIGYRRVVSENIHKGKTGNGFTIDEYYTVFDFPFDKVYPKLNTGERDFDGPANGSTSLAKFSSPEIKINAGLFNFNDSKQYLAQGYRMVQVNMHGLQKRNATYSGSYEKWRLGEPSHILAGQEFEYFQPGEQIRTMKLDESGELVSTMLAPGKEVDIARESKIVTDVSLDFSVELDISYGVTVLVFVGVFPSFSYTNNVLSQHASTKLISYPTILKSVTTTVEGISSRSENIAFDSYTGDPVIVKNSDSYTGSTNPLTGEQRFGDLYSFSIPASWVYKEMGQQWDNALNSNQLNSKVANFLVHNVEPDANWLKAPQNLISAVVNTYSKQWGDLLAQESRIQEMYPGSSVQSVIDKLNDKWLPKASYTYKKELDNTSNVPDRGTFDISGPVWGSTLAFNPLGWIKSNETVKYSPNSDALEQIDVLGIPSTVMFGSQYGNNVPVMVAGNADYNSILFKDFEGVEEPSNVAHSGNNSGNLNEISNLVPGVLVSSLLKKQGGSLQFWLNENRSGLEIAVTGADVPVSLSAVASVNGWTLYRGVIDPNIHLGNVGVGEPLVATLQDSNQSPFENLNIDDIRFQPLNATASAFVYDPFNYRLMTQFDDQHFGTYFQYNKEGKLVRKVVETERGKHTLQEMHYNTPKVSR